ncbi:MAG: hypothetical protein A4E55_00357 [Pelotomaculum sp. PtaU1.Bin035]|nr:MAG: hypothetical protein A4E55_00357 [Pelotomaculum sp. PtaU1.Bin035]
MSRFILYCKKCKKEQSILYSVLKPGETRGLALCIECANYELRKQGGIGNKTIQKLKLGGFQ